MKNRHSFPRHDELLFLPSASFLTLEMGDEIDQDPGKEKQS